MTEDVKALADDLRAAMRASPIDEDDTMLLVEPELLEAAADAIEALSVRERALVEALTRLNDAIGAERAGIAVESDIPLEGLMDAFDATDAARENAAAALTQSPSTGEGGVSKIEPRPNFAEFADALLIAAGLYTDVELAFWLNAPQPMLEMWTPVQLLARGDAARLLQVLRMLEDGVYD